MHQLFREWNMAESLHFVVRNKKSVSFLGTDKNLAFLPGIPLSHHRPRHSEFLACCISDDQFGTGQ